MKKLQKFLLLGALVALASCAMEATVEPDPGPGPGPEPPKPVDTNVTVIIPGGFGLVTTRALGSDEENAITDADLLLFTQDGVLDSIARVDRTKITQDNTGGNNRASLPVTLKVGAYNIVVLANAGNLVDRTIGRNVEAIENKSYSAVISQLVGSIEDKLFSSGGVIPMWGESGIVSISTSLAPIPVKRAFARIDVGVGEWNEGLWTGKKGGIEIPFVIREIYVMRPHDAYSAIPVKEDDSAGRPTIPHSAGKYGASDSENIFKYSGAADITTRAGVSYTERSIYVPEANVKITPDGTPGDANHTNRMALVIGGIFNGSRTTTYYRVDFFDGMDLLDVMRNHLYRFEISSVSGPGHSDVQTAYGETSSSMQANVVAWSNVVFDDVRFFGSQFVMISKNPAIAGAAAGEKFTITIRTNFHSFSFDDEDDSFSSSDIAAAGADGLSYQSDIFSYTFRKSAAAGEYTIEVETLGNNTPPLGVDPYLLDEWTFTASGEINVPIEIRQEWSATDPTPYTFTVVTNNPLLGTITSSPAHSGGVGKAKEGDEIRVLAAPTKGSLFAGWTVTQTIDGTTSPVTLPDPLINPLEFSMPAGDVAFRATFTDGTAKILAPEAPYLLYLDPATQTFQLGAWGQQITSISQMPYFQFGSVVAIKSEGATWLDDGSLVAFNPSNKTITTWDSVPRYESSDYEDHRNTSAPDYHNRANIALGKGDPCKLVGLTVEQIKAGVIDNGQWRLPTVLENIQFVGGPDVKHPQTKPGLFWKEWTVGGLNFNYKEDNADWSGDANTYPLGVTPNDTAKFDWYTTNGGDVANPNTGSFPIVAQGSTPKGYYIIPAAGNRHNSSGSLNRQGTYMDFWTSTPEGTSFGYHLTFFHNTTYPANRNLYNLSFSIRCVPASAEGFDIDIEATEGGSALANAEVAPPGTQVKAQATASVGHLFAGWRVVQAPTGFSLDTGANPVTFTMPTGSVILEARFISETPTAPYLLYYEPISKTLRLGTWGQQITSITQMPLFKFGSVVGMSTEGAWVDDGSRVVFNPSNATISDFSSVPSYVDADFATQKNTSAPSYHNAASIALGKGDPCKLVGLTVEQIKAGQVDNGQWRLPTVYDNVNFVGGPPTPYPDIQDPRTWWKTFDASSPDTYINYIYRTNAAYAGVAGRMPSPSTVYDQSYVKGTRSATAPDIYRFPVETTSYAAARTYSIPAAGLRVTIGGVGGAIGVIGQNMSYWSSTPHPLPGQGLLMYAETSGNITAPICPADDNIYDNGYAIRCVPNVVQEFAVRVSTEDSRQGSAMANASTAFPGATVTVQATPSVGMVFGGWEVVSGGSGSPMTLPGFDATKNPSTFTMPNGPVEIRAKFLGSDPNIITPEAPYILYYDPATRTLQVGAWEEQVTSITQKPHFKFGSVVALKSEPGAWVNDGSPVGFNPSDVSVTTWESVPVYEAADYEKNLRNVSDPAYHNAANIALGKGDPCKLVGLTVEQIKGGVIDNGQFRLPTVYENINFVGGPDVKHPQTKPGLFWKEWQIGGLNYTYKEDSSSWDGNTETYPLGVSPNNTATFDWWTLNGNNRPNPPTGAYPLVAQGSTPKGAYILPTSGWHDPNSGVSVNNDLRGRFWSSTPEGIDRGHYLVFDSNVTGPAGRIVYAYGFSIRCVATTTRSYEVTVESVLADGTLGGGSTIVDNSNPFMGEQVQILATPESGRYLFAGWNVLSAPTGFTLDASQNPARFAMPAGDVQIEALFLPSEVEINGTVWAGSNLAAVGVFAENAFDYGALFQWGRNVALPYESGTDNGWSSTPAPEGSWLEGARGPADPCPVGWRVPTWDDFETLIGGVSPGIADNEYTVISFVVGENSVFGTGLSVTSKSDSGTLLFPLPGSRNTSGEVWRSRGGNGIYWSSSNGHIPTAAVNLNLTDEFGDQAGRISSFNRLDSYSIRCVRHNTYAVAAMATDSQGTTNNTGGTAKVTGDVAGTLPITGASSGTSVTFSATASGDYLFGGWEVVGTPAAGFELSSEMMTSNPLTLTMPNGSLELRATFGKSTPPSEVEIGGTIWAGSNLLANGIFTAHETDYGIFYQWGRNVPYTYAGDNVTTGPLLGKFRDSDILETEKWPEDANPCPAGWRIPELSEYEELFAASTDNYQQNPRTLTTANGILTFPYSGWIRPVVDETTVTHSDRGYRGEYWSNTRFTMGQYPNTNMYMFHLVGTNARQMTNAANSTAFSVRCVKSVPGHPTGVAPYLLYLDGGGTLRAGAFDNSTVTVANMPHFKFGSVVGIKGEGAWVDGESLIPFDPSNQTITTWESVPVYTSDLFATVKDVSAENYTNVANIRAGKGDPCALVGYTAAQIRAMSNAELQAVLDAATLRLPTVFENINFVGGPATKDPRMVSTTAFWKDWQIGGVDFNFKEDSTGWAGDVGTYPIGTPTDDAVRFDWWIQNGYNEDNPGTGSYPLVAQSSTAAKTYTLPATGYRHYDTSGLEYLGRTGFYRSSTPMDAERSYNLYFNNTGTHPVNRSNYKHGYTVRCVPRREYTVGASAGTGGTAKVTDGMTDAEVSSLRAKQRAVFTATPATDYVFAGWEVVSGGITLTATEKGTNPLNLVMPAGNVSLRATFELASPDMVLYLDGGGRLQAGKFDNSVVNFYNMPYFKFGSVVGIKSDGAWVDGTSLIPFNPSNVTITTWDNIPMYDNNSTDHNNFRDTSASGYNNGTNVLAGKGDPCTLIGYSAAELKAMTPAQIDAVIAASKFRLPTVFENINFVGGPDVAHPGTKAGLFWKDWTVDHFYGFNYLEDSSPVAYRGDSNTYPLGVPPNNTAKFDWWIANGNNKDNPGTGSFPIVAQGATAKGTYILPLAGYRNDSGAPNLMYGHFWASSAVPEDLGRILTFSDTYIGPADGLMHTDDDFGIPVRCVARKEYPVAATGSTGGTAKVTDGMTDAEVSSLRAKQRAVFTATPATDYVFAGWEVVSGGITLTATERGTNPLNLIMPADNISLRATFAPITPDLVLYLDGGGRLQARKFDNSTVTVANIPYFKFGSVVGIKSEGAWVNGTSLVPFNPSNATISTWTSIPVYNNNSSDFANFKNVSDPAYTNVANIRAGKGDPCMLIGYSAAEIKAMSNAELQAVLDNAPLRLPTVMDNVNFVGGPANPYPNQRDKTFWKTFDPGSSATYISYNYRINGNWSGDSNTASSNIAEATYTQSLERKGSSLADPDLVKFPVETTDYADARTFTLPAAGYRDYSTGAPTYQGTNGYFWASTPYHSSGSGHLLLFYSSSAIRPALSNNYAYGYSVRCVSSAGVEARAMAVDNYGVDSNPGGTVQVAGGSSGSTSSARIKSGTKVTFRATPAAGHGFHAWSASGITLTDKQRITSPLTITMPANEVSLTAGFDHTPDYVPVPSGTTEMIVDDIIWASANVDDAGVFVQSNSGDAKYGKYFQWGRTVGYSYNHGSALPASGTDQTGNTVWPEAKDPCPTGWRIPTTAEWNAMLEASNKPTNSGDRNYVLSTGTLPLPAAGWNGVTGAGDNRLEGGFYWTANQNGSDGSQSLFFTYRDTGASGTSNIYKTQALPIRCVREEGNNSALTTRSAKVTARANGTVNMSGWGDVYSTSSQTTSTIGGVGVTFRAKANNGYIFTGWTASGVTLTNTQKTQNPLTITMPAGAVTLTATFASSPDQVLYLDGAGRLQAGKFDNSTVKASNMLYFKFGSVVGAKTEGAWVNGESLVPFNPSNATISTWASIPVYNNNSTDFYSFKNVSSSGYTSVANIRAGKGDPCMLVGYTAAQIRDMSNAELKQVLDNAPLRLPTVMDNVNFVGGPASPYPNQRNKTFWKTFNPASATYINYNYRINETWAGDGNTASTVVAEATYTQSLEIRGSSLADPDLVKLPVETTDYATARAYTLPAAGRRNYSNGALEHQGTYGRFWASTPYHSSGSGHVLAFGSTNGIWPAYYTSYAYGFSVRCVAR